MYNEMRDLVRTNQPSPSTLGYQDGGFDVFNNEASIWPAFLVGQRDSPVRTVVIDDDIHFVNVLAQELMKDERLKVVGKALSLKEGKRLCKGMEFDVALVDLTLADGSGFQLLELLHAIKPSCQIIVVTVMEQDESVSRAFELGASGYLIKHSWFSNYVQAILQVANGGTAISPHLVKRLLRRFDQPSAGCRHSPSVGAVGQEQLSSREKDILRMVASGHTSTEIAARLNISHMTVNTHIRNTYRKLQVRSRAQAVQSAMVRGLI